ncbi:MAG: hypothetical protein D6735_09205 [Acidobacteria bacterium]|nr:MAG: hypothetical protein D6735_09205 [Acidobacteriota bacterium]
MEKKNIEGFFNQVAGLVWFGVPVALVGPFGTGKTQAADEIRRYVEINDYGSGGMIVPEASSASQYSGVTFKDHEGNPLRIMHPEIDALWGKAYVYTRKNRESPKILVMVLDEAFRAPRDVMSALLTHLSSGFYGIYGELARSLSGYCSFKKVHPPVVPIATSNDDTHSDNVMPPSEPMRRRFCWLSLPSQFDMNVIINSAISRIRRQYSQGGEHTNLVVLDNPPVPPDSTEKLIASAFGLTIVALSMHLGGAAGINTINKPEVFEGWDCPASRHMLGNVLGAACHYKFNQDFLQEVICGAIGRDNGLNLIKMMAANVFKCAHPQLAENMYAAFEDFKGNVRNQLSFQSYDSERTEPKFESPRGLHMTV